MQPPTQLVAPAPLSQIESRPCAQRLRESRSACRIDGIQSEHRDAKSSLTNFIIEMKFAHVSRAWCATVDKHSTGCPASLRWFATVSTWALNGNQKDMLQIQK